MAIRAVDPEAQVIAPDDRQELDQLLSARHPDLILLNRELGYGFDDEMGIEAVVRLRATHPKLRLMLVSNYAQAQSEAVAAGALPGFGKRELGSPKVTQILRGALEEPAASPANHVAVHGRRGD
jgi:CheY-like chemotaxis protein